MVDKDWKNFKCEDCGRDIKEANENFKYKGDNYKYFLLIHHIDDSSKRKEVCVACFLKNLEYGNLYRRVVMVEFDFNPPHSFVGEEDIKLDSGESGQKVPVVLDASRNPDKTPEVLDAGKNGISKGEKFLIAGEVLIISLISIGLYFIIRKKNKQK